MSEAVDFALILALFKPKSVRNRNIIIAPITKRVLILASVTASRPLLKKYSYASIQFDQMLDQKGIPLSHALILLP